FRQAFSFTGQTIVRLSALCTKAESCGKVSNKERTIRRLGSQLCNPRPRHRGWLLPIPGHRSQHVDQVIAKANHEINCPACCLGSVAHSRPTPSQPKLCRG